MPAFTFEKISPPLRRGPIPPIAKKQRGIIVQILDRFVAARVKRTLRGEKGITARRQQHRPQDQAALKIITVIPGRVEDANPES